MSKVIHDPKTGTYKKFELGAFKEKEDEAERKKAQVDKEFKPDFEGEKDRDFVLGGFDFEYGGGYRRDEIAKKTSDEIEVMLAEARGRAKEIEDEAGKRGYEEGLKKGREDAAREVTSIVESMKKTIESLTDVRTEFFVRAEKEMVDLVTIVSAEIVLREIKEDEEIIAAVLRKAVEEIHIQQKIKVRVNPADLENVKNMEEKLLEEVDAIKGVEFTADRKITQGGCVIETNIGTLDATVENRLMAVHRSLREQLGKKG
ncbi:MAG: FliH/SctL family protein [Nitrospinota bacterium]